MDKNHIEKTICVRTNGAINTHSTEKCSSKLICGRCRGEGHPTQFCRRQPCPKCGEYHRRGFCDLWSALKEVRDVINAGGSLENLSLEVAHAEPKSSEYCAFAYVGPALSWRRSNNLNSMFPLDEERVLSDAEHLKSAENSEKLLEFTL
ncbi:hypothetical protein PHMEG_0001887 [Phytophthora megakarya]|uniref:Eukaryotic/viral aspartic protease n=1 Tax=Phytophthora megakarya TaxID=4795 RepID=A0A225X1Q9_9STRA|nr:hypothetical protein PHMEG_0001887 [Phytophthora megakarya]